MNPLAKELNDQLAKESPSLYQMLSARGKSLFFPKGILTQSAEAKAKAHRFNATLGIATEHGMAMHLACIQEHLLGIQPNDAFTYAPAAGKPELRKKWQEKLLTDNPSLRGKSFSLPIVTNAITHGLSIAGELFIDEGDTIILPDKLWGNYRLIFNVRLGATLKTFPLYNEGNGFNTQGLKKTISEIAKDKTKVVVLLNFPNNPTGYSITLPEAREIVNALKHYAEKGLYLIVISDDAYFSLFYDDEVMKESLFAHTADLHERILAIKLDAATKEHFVWGFRVGFLTYSIGGMGNRDITYTALEKKTMGAIRGTISNSPHLSQTLVLKALEKEACAQEKRNKYEILRTRALKTKELLNSGRYDDAWTYYPFNSGYFMCLKLNSVNAERLRVHLLDRYGVGIIAVDDTDVRIAFSCLEEDTIQEFLDIIYQGVKDLS